MSDHYCNRSDIEAQLSQYEFKKPDNKPNRRQLLKIIERIADEMDGRLKVLGFAVPITTGSTSLDILRSIAVNGVTGTTLESTASNQPIKKSTIPRWEGYFTRYEAALKRIEANPKILGDAGGFSEKAGFESYQRVTTDPSAAPRFEIGEKF